MRALVTGSTGTLGKVLCPRLERAGHEVVRWDRAQVPVDDYAAMERFVRDARPDVLFHLAAASRPSRADAAAEAWAVNYEWPSELAWITRQLGVRFVLTSTVLVFTDALAGPYTIVRAPDASGGYGAEKRRAEARVFSQNPDARVVRLGWQIGRDLTGNQMSAWLAERAASGPIDASATWIPACSFLEDTADALMTIEAGRPGLYQLDANEGWTFYDLACALRAMHGASWEIRPTYHHCHDQRMIDARCRLPALVERLAALRAVP